MSLINNVEKSTTYLLSLLRQNSVIQIILAVAVMLLFVVAVIYVVIQRKQRLFRLSEQVHEIESAFKEKNGDNSYDIDDNVSDDTAELPVIQELEYTNEEFSVEQDITYIHSTEKIM